MTLICERDGDYYSGTYIVAINWIRMGIMMKKSSIFGKKQMVLALLVAALGVAVYLNFVLIPPNSDGELSGDTGSSKNLGDTAYVNTGVSSGDALVSGTTATEGDYFKNARTDREKAHDNALAMLKEIMNDVKATAAAKDQIAASAALLSKNIENENAIETLLKGKGYADAVAVISDDKVSVVVKTENLLNSQTLQIQDIVVSQTRVALENITIIPKK